jgi:hypothetical protein
LVLFSQSKLLGGCAEVLAIILVFGDYLDAKLYLEGEF